MTYDTAGTYTWAFRDQDDFYYNGSVTVEVTAAQATLLRTRRSRGASTRGSDGPPTRSRAPTIWPG
ncbi:hypothetical protein G7085_07510 [Tessaracoccus sp. HDW20]|uniref:hypothetical protein n=1 Tax=Tessaracoccus coleopterorum TaxID=2714950 RepID=UPI0018D45DBA|nr:hypothetical protein [Tessaracoccus coleopterorum]NHB84499.1 hypothetical protein [Tessaracoccus coleopterorum]